MTKEEVLSRHYMTTRAILWTLIIISAVLWGIWRSFGVVNSPWLVIFPRKLESLSAILTSGFLHANLTHVLTNILSFLVIGFIAFKSEGTRVFAGMLAGLAYSGLAQWLLGPKEVMHLGFSGVIFALIGIIFVSAIRSDNLFRIGLVCIFFYALDSSFFDSIRPTELTEKFNISWLGHLGGFIGGVWHQVRSTDISLENLLRDDILTIDEYHVLMARANGEEVTPPNEKKKD